MSTPDSPIRVVLWRHGQTDWNVENRFQGHSDIPLNKVGHYQASEAAKVLAALRPDRIISSDLIRAQETAAPLAGLTDIKIEINPNLRETDGGLWEGKLASENRATHGELFANWYEGGDEPAGVTGERRSDVAKRAVAVIEKETTNFSGTIVFVTHGGTVRSVLGSILKLPIAQWGVIGGLSNACWSILELTKHHTGSRWYLAEHNAGSLPEPVFGDDAVN
ncbi:MAG: histidine phosphatase family protein [Actinobacteria bacterium]|nr:histidine phosphatase family protein [Actinomycetota bacterium]